MAVDAASILAVAQVARIAVELIEQHQRGELTEDGLDAAWGEIHARATAGRQRWEDSKQSPAALARRGETPVAAETDAEQAKRAAEANASEE